MADGDVRAEALQEARNAVEKSAIDWAPFYAAKLCPRDFTACRGPRCMLYMPEASMGPNGAPIIGGGSCAVAVIAGQIGPIGNDLVRLMELNQAPGGTHIIR